MKKLCLVAFGLFTAGVLMAQWTKLPGFTTGNLLDVDFSSPDTGVVAGENGAVFKTADGGLSWESISPAKDFTFTSIAVKSPADYFVSGFKNFDDGSGITELFATNDAGQTWKVIFSYDVVGEPSQVRCEKDNLYFLGAWKGLQKSSDGGSNWELMFRGGGTTVLSDLKTDPANPESVFVFGTIGGFASYSTMFRHSAKGSKWDAPDPFDFDNASAYSAFDLINDTILLFRNFYNRFMPNDTSNVLSAVWGFVRDDIIPGGATGDTAWHFNIRTVNDRIPHYVSDCHFFSLSGLGYSVEKAGGINQTKDGGKTWTVMYNGVDPLNSICMVSDTAGYVVGEKGTVVKMGSGTSIVPDNPDNNLDFSIFPVPATDLITIETNGVAGTASLVVVDGLGREMIHIELTRNPLQIDIGTWPPGSYFATLRNGKSIVVNRIVRN
jgi:photosystem II stability/assembly factor-like uncharacterized protein